VRRRYNVTNGYLEVVVSPVKPLQCAAGRIGRDESRGAIRDFQGELGAPRISWLSTAPRLWWIYPRRGENFWMPRVWQARRFHRAQRNRADGTRPSRS